MKIIFILVEPQYPENIGAAARALNTMGFDELRLVNPTNHLSDPAKWLAHGSIHLLENAMVFQNLEEAFSDMDLVVGTSAKERKSRYNYIPSEEIKSYLFDRKENLEKVGIVLGNEDKGLSSDQLDLCHVISYIPLAKPHPSINLSQAVMIYSYLLSELDEREGNASRNKLSLGELREELNEQLNKLGIQDYENIHKRIHERISMLNDSDAKILFYILSKMKEK